MFSKKSQINELNKITIFISVIFPYSVLLQVEKIIEQNGTDFTHLHTLSFFFLDTLYKLYSNFYRYRTKILILRITGILFLGNYIVY